MRDLLGKVQSPRDRNEDRTQLDIENGDSTMISVDDVHDDELIVPIRERVEYLQKATNHIKKLQASRFTAPEQKQSARKEFEEISAKATMYSRETHNLLQDSFKKLEAQTRSGELSGVKSRWTSNQLNTWADKYQSALIEFQRETVKFKHGQAEDFTRQARIINPEITDTQVQEMLMSEDPAEYLEMHLMNTSAAMQENIIELESRHHRVQKLEQTIREIQKLFESVSILVTQASQKLDDIRENVESVRVNVDKGHKEVVNAEQYTRQQRKYQIYIWILAIILLAGLGIFVFLWFIKPMLGK